MLKYYIITLCFISNISVIISQQPFSWFADPYTVGFNYTDNEAIEQQASSWQPGLFQFFENSNYNSGSFLTPSAFNIDNWQDVGGTQILKNRMLLGYDKINLSDENGLRTLIDKNGYTLVNDANYQIIRAFN